MGHGGGEKYIKGERIKTLNKCASCLLIGCSSGSLHDWGEYDMTGTLMNYMIAQCPCLLVNLWDVTDRDIDRFSKGVFHHWGLFRENDPDLVPMTLCEAVSQSRKECILK